MTLKPRGPLGVYWATIWSLKGLAAAFKHEESFRLEVYLFLILAPLGFWLGETPVEQVILVSSLIIVLIAEILNSSIEAVIDKVIPEQNEMAGRAKDMGSAAVFLTDVNVLLCWIVLLWPHA